MPLRMPFKSAKTPATDTIVLAITRISKCTATLDSHITAFRSQSLPLGIFDILNSHNALTAEMKQGIAIVQSYPKLDIGEALAVRKATQQLLQVIQQTLSNLRAAKKKFDELYIATAVLSRALKQNRIDAKLFGEAVVEKIPKFATKLANSPMKQIDDEFVRSIEAYEGGLFGWGVTL